MKSRRRNLDNSVFLPSSQSRPEGYGQLNIAERTVNRKVLDGPEFLRQSGYVVERNGAVNQRN